MKKLLLSTLLALPMAAQAALPNAVLLQCGKKGNWVVEYTEPDGQRNGEAIMYELPDILPQFFGAATPTNINVERNIGDDRVLQILVDRFDGITTWNLYTDGGLKKLESNYERCIVVRRALD